MSITIGKFASGGYYEDTTSGNGQSVRIYTPPVPTSPRTLVIWCHPHIHNQQIDVGGYFAYAYARACMAQGWYFAASNMHADSWGNSNAKADVLDLYNLINGRDTLAKCIIIGSSMGGLAAFNVAAAGTISTLVGVYLADGCSDLSAMYNEATATFSSSASAGATSISSSVSYASGTKLVLSAGTARQETITTNGSPTGSGPYTLPTPSLAKSHNSSDSIGLYGGSIATAFSIASDGSDYATQTSGYDPQAMSAGSFPAIRYRWLASSADTNVPKATHADAMSSKLSARGLEYAVRTHLGAHLAGGAADPADFVSFAQRCIA